MTPSELIIIRENETRSLLPWSVVAPNGKVIGTFNNHTSASRFVERMKEDTAPASAEEGEGVDWKAAWEELRQLLTDQQSLASFESSKRRYQTIIDWMDQIAAPPATPEAVEALLFAQVNNGGHNQWLILEPAHQSGFWSAGRNLWAAGNILSVNREKSTDSALAIYDRDCGGKE